MDAAAHLPLFIYGTLRDSDILAAVLGRPIPGESLRLATAPGWRAVYFPGEVYPALIGADRESATGLLVEGLSPGDMERLDAFEGDQYRREIISVLAEAEAVSAQTYLPALPIAPDARPWTLENWARTHRPDVIGAELELAIRAARRSGK